MYKTAKWRVVSIFLTILVIMSGLLTGCDRTPEPDVTVPPAGENQVAEKYKWDLTSFYDNREAFEADVRLLQEEYIPALAEFSGKLNNAADLQAFFELDTEASIIFSNIYVYAYLLSNLDLTDTEATELSDIASALMAEYNSAIAFVEPEILSLDESVLRSFLDEPELVTYRYYLQTLRDRQEHVLSDKEEQMLAAVSELASSPENIFYKVLYADFTFPEFTDKDGREITLDWAAYDTIMEDPDREYRQSAYEAMWEAFWKFNNTLSATYIAQVKTDIFFAESREYTSSLEKALAGENLPRGIYDNLIETTNNNLDSLHRYFSVYKNALGLDELHSYDTSLPLVKDYQMNLSFDEAAGMVADALKPLGDAYVSDFTNGINSRWIDVYPDVHKYTGCFSWGSYTSHPYILLNYDDSLWSALSVAHEMGHSLNTLYSNRAQEYINADYTIFTAEVASMTNEFLVMDYLIKNAATDEERLYLLLEELNYIKTSFFGQVMYSEFEQIAHEKAESGEPLSPDTLNSLWLGLIKKYFGPAFTVDEVGAAGWSRIPHFYSAFYVYKYATSAAAARQIADDIIAGKDGALERYLDFLAAGGSDYPVELIKNAGVDMNSPAVIDNLIARFGELVDEVERLLPANTLNSP